LELIPSSEDYVDILEGASEESKWLAEKMNIEDILSNADTIPGKLVEVEGRIARIEEFTYSYEIDLFDENGNKVSLYLDKETGITLEEIESDQFYQVTGIMEYYDGNLQLYPRLQSDLARIYEPGLAIQVLPPTTAIAGEPFEVEYKVTNHAPDSDQNIIISTRIDPQLEVMEIYNQGKMDNNSIIWDMDKMDGGSASVSVSFLAQLTSETEYVIFDDYRVLSTNWSVSTYGFPSYTFRGLTVPIWAIQGTGSKSSYILEELTTQGVVTGVFPKLEGFWIQEKESDDDQTTSPGVFVRTGPILPEINRGDLVMVTGRVRESFQQTELELLSNTSLKVIGQTALPVPVKLDPPIDNEASLKYYEALEGVLVSVSGPATVVGPTTRYGEFSIVLPQHGLTRSWQNDDHGMLIHVDDGTSFTHQTRDTITSAVSVGDQVFKVMGPLAFSFGNYKIEPISEFPVQAGSHEVSYLETLQEGFFSIMTWNVENLFDFVVPHPSSPPLPKVSEYKRDITKVALTIEAAGFPTVIGFQEVENIEILEDIAAEPVLVDYQYQAILIEGTDSRGIDVGYLIRGDQVLIVDQVQYPSPGNITSRPPLMVEIKFGEDPGQTLYVLNNHFTSISGGEKATEPRRNAQAAWNLEIALELLDEDPLAPVAIIGDLNSYYNSPPIQTIQEGGFQSVFDSLAPEERYTYVYEGNSQVLDHILMNKSLEALLVSINVLHSNADFTLPYSTDESIIHKSDHDPVIAVFVVP
jgi:predicted extracellular nuclease